MKKIGWLVLTLLLVGSVAVAMQRGYGGRRGYRELNDRRGVPSWEVNPSFKHDVFTFARVRYDSYGRGGGWATDYPDSDLNFSLRLQQLTSMKVNPDPIILDLTDPALFDYPFLYMIEPGGIALSQPEVAALRKYCMNGGFMMVDDFWGDYQWRDFEMAMEQVFPERKWQEVPLEHEIFHIVYDLKEKPQVPSIHAWQRGFTHELGHGGNTETPHYRAIFDDDGRIMVFICHNTDLGDGWEREGENHEYFEEFSVKKSYPLGINIVTYAMTH
jgi:hypothetical protein